MSFFSQPKPRRFHHEPIYYDEHTDRVKNIERRARKELGLDSTPESRRESLRGVFTNDVREKRQRLRQLFRHAGRGKISDKCFAHEKNLLFRILVSV